MLSDTLQFHPGLMEDSLPETLALEVTNHCNLRCTHCGHHHYPKFEKGNIELKYFDMIKPILGKGKIENLHLSDYGESFLSPRWKEVFARAIEIPEINISFITNGILLHKFWNLFNHPGLSFNVSFDGASEETYSHFRGKGNFQKVMKNLHELKFREERGDSQTSMRGFIVVLSQINVHEMSQIIKLAHNLGFNHVVFTFQVFYEQETFSKESLYFAKDQYDKNLELAIIQAEKLGIDLLYADSFNGKFRLDEKLKKNWLFKNKQNQIQCGASEKTSYIKFHGQVEPCCLPDRLPLGSLQNNNFKDIWYGSYYRKLRLSFIQNHWLANCENCNFLQSIDVHLQQSHRINVIRDDGRHIDMPQPYKITQVNKLYIEALTLFKKTPDSNIKASISSTPLTETQSNIYSKGLDKLLQLSRIESQFYEVENAMGVIWHAMKDYQKAKKFFERGLLIKPDDKIIKYNLQQLNLLNPK